VSQCGGGRFGCFPVLYIMACSISSAVCTAFSFSDSLHFLQIDIFVSVGYPAVRGAQLEGVCYRWKNVPGYSLIFGAFHLHIVILLHDQIRCLCPASPEMNPIIPLNKGMARYSIVDGHVPLSTSGIIF